MAKNPAAMDAATLAKICMPRDMSNWLDFNIKNNNYIEVTDEGSKGYLIKSEDCTIVFFPNWNCDEQVARIANKLVDEDEGIRYY